MMNYGVPKGFLKKWRMKRKLTLEQMGDLTGYHWISIWRFENEKRKVSRRLLAMIAQIQKGEKRVRAKNRANRR